MEITNLILGDGSVALQDASNYSIVVPSPTGDRIVLTNSAQLYFDYLANGFCGMRDTTLFSILQHTCDDGDSQPFPAPDQRGETTRLLFGVVPVRLILSFLITLFPFVLITSSFVAIHLLRPYLDDCLPSRRAGRYKKQSSPPRRPHADGGRLYYGEFNRSEAEAFVRACKNSTFPPISPDEWDRRHANKNTRCEPRDPLVRELVSLPVLFLLSLAICPILFGAVIAVPIMTVIAPCLYLLRGSGEAIGHSLLHDFGFIEEEKKDKEKEDDDYGQVKDANDMDEESGDGDGHWPDEKASLLV